METQIPRTVSLDNIPSAPSGQSIYRNPRLDEFGNQSVFDRQSPPHFNLYENPDIQPPNTSNDLILNPEFNSKGTSFRASLPVVHLEPFDGKSDKVSVEEWFLMLRLMGEANRIPEEELGKRLPFYFRGGPLKICMDLIKEGVTDLSRHETEICRIYGKNCPSPTDLQTLNNCKFDPSKETVREFIDKMEEYCKRVDPKMSLPTKRLYCIEGFSPKVKQQAYLEEDELARNKPLQQLCDRLTIICQVYEPKDSIKKSVRFLPPNLSRREHQNWNSGRTSYPRNNTGWNSNRRESGFYSRNSSPNRSNDRSNKNPEKSEESWPNQTMVKVPNNSNQGPTLPTRVCYNCGEPGHYRYNCPKRQTNSNQAKN